MQATAKDKHTEICLTIISSFRPVLLKKTLASFQSKFFNNFRISAVQANIDPIMGTSEHGKACEAILRDFFPNADLNIPTSPGLSKAIQHVWSRTDDKLPVFHMEDDWILESPISPIDLDAFQDPTIGMLIPSPTDLSQGESLFRTRNKPVHLFGYHIFSRKVPSFGTTPRFLAPGLARRYASLLDISMDPEKQVTQNQNRLLCKVSEKFRCKRFYAPNGKAVLRDIGIDWRQEKNISKEYEGAVVRWKQSTSGNHYD